MSDCGVTIGTVDSENTYQNAAESVIAGNSGSL